MAATFITYSPTASTHGKFIQSALTQLQGGLQTLTNLIAAMTRMIDGDGSNPAQFTLVTAKFGFPDNATAQAAWNELNSVYFKLSSDGNTDHVNAALLQVFSKFLA